MGARYYAAWLGRWTSADPMGIGADGPGLYNYTRGSPINLIDPSGHAGMADHVDDANAGRPSVPSKDREHDFVGVAKSLWGDVSEALVDTAYNIGQWHAPLLLPVEHKLQAQRDQVRVAESLEFEGISEEQEFAAGLAFSLGTIGFARGGAAIDDLAEVALATEARTLRPTSVGQVADAVDDAGSVTNVADLAPLREKSVLEILVGNRPSGTLVEGAPDRLVLRHYTDSKGREGIASSRELRASDPETAWSLNREGKYDAGFGDRSNTPNVFLTDLAEEDLAMRNLADPDYVGGVLGIRSTEHVILLDVAKLREAGIPVYKNPSLPNVYNAIADSIPDNLFEKLPIPWL